MDTSLSIANTNDQAAHWREAAQLWLGRMPANTQRAYRQAWASYMQTVGAEPWRASRADVARWVSEMQQRGLSAATIAQRIAAVSSFYKYAGEDYAVMVDGQERALAQNNPAAGKTLRPKVIKFGKARALSVAETQALLGAIRRDSGEQGLRDMALFMGYIFSARRNTEWRAAKWGDFQEVGSVVWYDWSGKGKEGKIEIPAPVWGAVKAYLMATRRWGKLRDGDYLFRALPREARTIGTSRENAPIAANQVGRLLKKYCRWAGLSNIRVHDLRHTATMLRRLAGDDIETISRWLSHSSLSVTQIYLHQLEAPRDESWQRVATLLGIAPAEGTEDKRNYRPYLRRGRR